MKSLLQFSLLILAFLACGLLQKTAWKHRPSDVDSLLALPALPASVLQTLSLGLNSAAADLSYIQAIQLYGDRRQGSEAEQTRRNLAVYRLVDYATDLDPGFAYAYIFGGLVVPIPQPDGSALNADEAASILRKGTRAVPGDWRIPFHLTYILSTYLLDFSGAANAAKEASERPGRPDYLPLLATRLAAQGGSLETGIFLARAMLDKAETDDEREQYATRILLLEMEVELQRIDFAAADFEARHDRRPRDIAELQHEGFLGPLPPEPHGGEWRYNRVTGYAESTGAERLRLASGFIRQLKERRGIDLGAPSTPSPLVSP